MPARDFFELLKTEQVNVLVDTRLSREYRSARFAHGGDLPYLCESFGIGYVHFTDLAPSQELRKDFHAVLDQMGATQMDRAQAWTAFLKGYLQLLMTRKILAEDAAIRQLLYGNHARVAFMCACAHHMDCHRRVLVGVLANYIEGLTVEHLNPETVGGQPPRLKTPRRYLLEDLPRAGVQANPPRTRRS
jgi:uncharacterized protein YeaO (DUF488 family)